MVVIYNWSRTSAEHIKHLSGFSATADQRNIRERLSRQSVGCALIATVLYLTMRFAKTIRSIQGLQAYHAGDKLIAEVCPVAGREQQCLTPSPRWTSS